MKKIYAWLYKCNFGSDKNSYYARPKSNGVVDNKEIARRIIDDGSEFQMETLVNILDQADRIRGEVLLEGYRVHTNFVNTQLLTSGVSAGKMASGHEFNLKVNSSPASSLQKEMLEAKLEILGVADSGPVISNVTDYYTKSKNQLITPLQVLRIEGDRLKIDGDPAANGVFFINTDEQRVKVEQIISNQYRELLLIIPQLAKGHYQLEIATQFNKGGRPLNKPHRSLFQHQLEVL